MALFDVKQTEAYEKFKKYTQSVKLPQYLPSSKKPLLEELVNQTKTKELLRHINESNVPEEEKEFLRLGAMRHLVFNYSKIADYYAHSDKEMQKLMEESALVIIDFDDAIANGYVELSKTLKALRDYDEAQKNAE